MVKTNATMEPSAVIPADATDDREQERLFTREEVEHIVDARLAEFKAEVEQQISELRGETKPFAQMSGGQPQEYDAQEREENLAQRESEITRRELRAGAVEELAVRGLPSELEKLIDYSDAETCAASINMLERVFRSAVQQGVDERIHLSRAKLPRSGGNAQTAMFDRMRAAAGLNG